MMKRTDSDIPQNERGDRIFSDNLKAVIKVSGKMQKEVAKDIGVPQQTLNGWCNRISVPKLSMLRTIAEYFDVSIDELAYKDLNKTGRSTAASDENTTALHAEPGYTMVKFYMDDDLKKDMENVCGDLGMSMTTALTIFAKKMAREKRIPFDVSVD